MQADAGLVEDIEHVHQSCPYLCGKAYALAFPATQTAAVAVEREVADAHIDDELDAGEDFVQYLVGYDLLLGLEAFLEVQQPVVELGKVELCHLADVHAVDFEGEALGLQAVAVAFRARHGVHERGSPFLQCRGALVRGNLHDVVDNALETGAVVHLVGILHAGEVAGAVENGVHGILGEGGHRVVDGEMIVPSQILQFAV